MSSCEFQEDVSNELVAPFEKDEICSIAEIDSALMRQYHILYWNTDTVDSEYKLMIGKKDAIDKGVTSEIYEQYIADLQLYNFEIQEFKKECDMFELLPVQNNSDANNNIIAASDVKRPNGAINTNDSSWGYDGFEVPFNIDAVRFTYTPRAAPTPTFSCGVNCFGKIQGKSKLACMGINSEIELPVAASGSGIWAKLSFRTTDSKGGVCRWVGRVRQD